MPSNTNQLAVIISRARDRSPQRDQIEQDLAAELARRGAVQLVTLPHLYDLAPDGSAFEHLRGVSGDVVVMSWLYPRAAFWVLDANGVSGRMGRTSLAPVEEVEPATADRRGRPAPTRTIWCVDLRSAEQAGPLIEEVDRILEATGRAGPATAASPAPARIDEPTTPRWYPVVDYSRCGGCLECLNFCLFGVYDLGTDEAVLVEQPDACRPGCPACARICPTEAIMFPQHQDPAIAGDGRGPRGAGLGPDLVQLQLGGAGPGPASTQPPQALAEQERQQHRASGPARPFDPTRPRDKDELDRLVDGLDELEER